MTAEHTIDRATSHDHVFLGRDDEGRATDLDRHCAVRRHDGRRYSRRNAVSDRWPRSRTDCRCRRMPAPCCSPRWPTRTRANIATIRTSPSVPESSETWPDRASPSSSHGHGHGRLRHHLPRHDVPRPAGADTEAHKASFGGAPRSPPKTFTWKRASDINTSTANTLLPGDGPHLEQRVHNGTIRNIVPRALSSHV